MSLIHNIIKIRFIEAGYVPDLPYHLISDSEMCDAFLNDDETKSSYFYDMYPCVDPSLRGAYDALVHSMKEHIQALKESTDDAKVLPDWIYSYMLGVVVGPTSSSQDIHDVLVLIGKDNLNDEFDVQAARFCYETSRRWLQKVPQARQGSRPPTIFGEPHVIKSLRLLNLGTTSATSVNLNS